MDLHHTAIHEAGHFLVAHYYEWVQVETVLSVVEDESSWGHIANTKDPLMGQSAHEVDAPEAVRKAGLQAVHNWYDQEEQRTAWAREQALKCAVMFMAGAEACRIAGLSDPDDGSGEDCRYAYEHLSHFLDALGEPQAGDDLIYSMMEVARVRARGVVGWYHRLGILEAVAEILKEKETLTGEQAAHIVSETLETA